MCVHSSSGFAPLLMFATVLLEGAYISRGLFGPNRAASSCCCGEGIRAFSATFFSVAACSFAASQGEASQSVGLAMTVSLTCLHSATTCSLVEAGLINTRALAVSKSDSGDVAFRMSSITSFLLMFAI